jgi:uncharacterized membrane protein
VGRHSQIEFGNEKTVIIEVEIPLNAESGTTSIIVFAQDVKISSVRNSTSMSLTIQEP